MGKEKTDPFRTAVIFYSFILTVLVIWIHAVDPGKGVSGIPAFTGGAGPFLQELLGSCLGQIAVPGFFCLSAYLFFRNAEHLDAAFYRNKWRSRIRTLVIPYLLWNLIYYLIYLAAGKTVFSLPVLLDALLFHRYHPVFWYLKELILLTAAAPLTGLLVKNKKAALPMLILSFLGAVFYERLPVHLINEDAFFYYMTGAALALHAGRTEADPDAQRKFLPAALLLFVFCETVALFFPTLPSNVLFFVIGARLSGLLAAYSLSVLCISGRAKDLPGFMKDNFFVYAVHYLEIRFFQMAAGLVFGEPLSDGTFAALYLVMPLLCIAVSAFTAKQMRRRCPALYSLLTGGRA